MHSKNVSPEHGAPYILWLPSWYPNEREPFNGDFIQRHARATALHFPVTVIHITQFGEWVPFNESKVVVHRQGQLQEVTVYFRFRPLGIGLLDKLRYNLEYYRVARRFLATYFQKNGLPQRVHVHVPVKAGNLARWIQRKFGLGYVLSEHASTYLPEAPDNFFKRHFWYRRQVRQIFQQAAAVINVSATIGNVLRDLFRLKEVRTIHNVVDTDHFRYSGRKAGIFTFIHVSTLSEQKNIEGMLRAFEALQAIRTDWRLQIVGPPNAEVERLVAAGSFGGRVVLTGEVPYTGVAEQMKRAHALVLFSRHENFPCVVVEALCCGLPVIASDVAGIKEAVNGSNGLLVPPGDGQKLLEALLHMRERYPQYHTEAIAAKASAAYNYPAIGGQIFNVYQIHPGGRS
ncbi:glycosyltransferase [Paraflavisolibacter sp. H34]|uniref:glycosyltransferase n=1 Tax=Huijunlia imazamoxiresistens TaxID=3127457 RepID=UPI00301B0F9C